MSEKTIVAFNSKCFGFRLDVLILRTQQPPAKAGGLVLWTESPDTGRKTRLIFSPEVIIDLRFKMMIQVFFNHSSVNSPEVTQK
jgi:hypothetical protein